ncbi:protein of unknown function DUF4357 [Desulfovibrio sp. X2]|uniref:GIY-YIG nuclease family protein n=1 Tax=Desulfovibrio sp. X2 TaxID=941449 RepID=UPI000358B7FC|nr:GIY-YIG nuclease family protein [Desulfovibrio sp. X2]EPR43546.1 protein of unknown function DUF4357 [Desulfovibrio sp. X2]
MTVGSTGRSLELFFIDGKPDGMQTAEMFNWTGHVLMAPRTRIKAALDRKEAKYTGIYLLLGDKDDKPFAYIGEGEDISDRIKNHDQKKDWWTQAVLVTTGANTLNKAHVKYLESRLVEIAKRVKQRDLENGNTPPRPGLSEAAQANMESFLEYLLMTLPALRIDMFLDKASPKESTGAEATESGESSSLFFELASPKHGLAAKAKLVDGEFIVLKGSTARLRWKGKGSWDSTYAKLHEELRATEVLVEDGGHCVFAKSYAFRSTSAAAAVIKGRPASGPAEWKVVGTGQTYREWEASQLHAAALETA